MARAGSLDAGVRPQLQASTTDVGAYAARCCGCRGRACLDVGGAGAGLQRRATDPESVAGGVEPVFSQNTSASSLPSLPSLHCVDKLIGASCNAEVARLCVKTANP